MSSPAGSGERRRERRIRDRARVMAGLRRRAERACRRIGCLGLDASDQDRHERRVERFVRWRYRPASYRHPTWDPNPRRCAKQMGVQERRELNAAEEQRDEAGIRFRLTRFRK